MRKTQELCGRHVHPLAKGRVVEVFVTANSKQNKLVPFTGIDGIGDSLLIGGVLLGIEIYRGVEISLGLEILRQIALALHQQVLVDGAFLEYRKQVALGSTGDARALDAHFHRGTGVNVQMRRHRVRGGLVFQFDQRHLRHQVIVTLIPGADGFKSPLQSGFGQRLPAKQAPEPLPSAGGDDAVGGAVGIAGNHHAMEFRSLAGVDLKFETGFVGGGVQLRVGMNHGAVKPVAPGYILERRLGLFQVGLGVFTAQLKFGGDAELSGVGRIRDAGDGDMPDEPCRLGDEFQFDAAVDQRGVHLDVAVLAGGIQALDGRAQVGGG